MNQHQIIIAGAMPSARSRIEKLVTSGRSYTVDDIVEATGLLFDVVVLELARMLAAGRPRERAIWEVDGKRVKVPGPERQKLENARHIVETRSKFQLLAPTVGMIEKMAAAERLAQKLAPLVEELELQAKKHRVDFSPVAVRMALSQIKPLLAEFEASRSESSDRKARKARKEKAK